MTTLAILWKNKAIGFPTKIELYKSLALSILLHECESWALIADLERQTHALQNKCYGRMHITNKYV